MDDDPLLRLVETKMSQDSAPRRDGVLGGIGRACYRHRWLTLLSWILGVACLITLWTRFGAAADNNFTGADPGQTVLNQHFHRQSGDALTLAIRSSGEIRSASVRSQVDGTLARFAHAPGVTSVTSPYQAASQISRSGHVAFATIQFAAPSADVPNSEALALMQDATSASGHGTTFSLGGDVVDLAETPYGGPTEGIGVGAAAIVLLIAFGSLLAMGLPVLTAVFGIGSGLSLIALLGHVVPAPSFAPIVASMIGLGVGVDYALFIVTRFREALRGDPGGRASGQALRGDPGGRLPWQAQRPGPAPEQGSPGRRACGCRVRGGTGGAISVLPLVRQRSDGQHSSSAGR